MQTINRNIFFCVCILAFDDNIIAWNGKKIGSYAFMSSNEYKDRIINVYCDAVVPPALDGGSHGYPFAYGYYGYNASSANYTVGERSFKVYVVSGSESAYKEDNMWKKAQSIEAYK